MKSATYVFAGGLLLCLFFGPGARADLPVHCLKHQVVGEWDFTLSPETPERQHCGHHTPDREEAQPKIEITEKGKTTKRFNLLQSNQATSNFGAEKANGMWTMVYDEGFDVQMSGYNFFAFSRFDLSWSNGVKKNISRCGETQVGWYSNVDKSSFGCFVAKKTGAEKHESFLQSFVPPVPAKSDAYYNVKRDMAWHQKRALELNQRQEKTWTAKAYPRWAGKSMKEVNEMMGLKRSYSRAEAGKNLLEPTQPISSSSKSFMQTARRHDNAKNATTAVKTKFPKTFDWRNATDGKNYLDPVMDQGACGSCYVVAMTRMLTARHKIATKDPEAVPFSINYPLFCSEYNQGCNGGYGFLVAKWSEDVGMVPATCARYNVNDGKCGIPKDCIGPNEKRWRASNPRYVGGFYGAASVENMMQELYTKGPMSAGLEPADDFMFYESGVYQSANAPSLKHHNPAPGEWERVDHAVLLVGWGEEDGKKYWTLQNSWGPDWGEDGFFRIQMGENDSGIESIAEAADVVEDEKKGKNVVSFQAWA